MMEYDIPAAIPHRPPFLLVDEVLELTADSIRAASTLRAADELWSRIYSGHYPGNPITPGVLLLEVIFQASAVLAAETVRREKLSGVPMVTRIQSAKFKQPILPDERVEITATLKERMANAFFMKGAILKNGAKAVEAEFAVALATPEAKP